jgi:hypothetical protein
MLAEATFDEHGSSVRAMCLADGGPMRSKYTPERATCHGFKPNTCGVVDDPPDYGKGVRAAYLREEGEDALKAAGEEGGHD